MFGRDSSVVLSVIFSAIWYYITLFYLMLLLSNMKILQSLTTIISVNGSTYYTQIICQSLFKNHKLILTNVRKGKQYYFRQRLPVMTYELWLISVPTQLFTGTTDSERTIPALRNRWSPIDSHTANSVRNHNIDFYIPG